MKPGFEPGIAREVAFLVTEDMCPAFSGVVVHRCCSTWTLVHQMEIAARRVLVEYLDPDEEGIGAHVSVDHVAPAKLGRTVRVRAELVEASPRRAVCEVTAYVGDHIIGKGRQVQVILPREKINRLIERS